jgi:ATP-dependent Lon protease
VTYIRSRCAELAIEPDFYKSKDIHVHFPEGGIPKDGPSAGIAVATALVSVLTGAPVRRDVAMTGEITLRGRVLPVGGLKEKTMAAFRYGAKTVVMAADNGPDLADIDPAVRSALNFVLVDHMDDVLKASIDFALRPKPIEVPVALSDAVTPVPVDSLPAAPSKPALTN